MNVHYEELYNDIELIHDIETLQHIKEYNYKLRELIYSLVVDDTKKPIFECCREYMNYLQLLSDIIDNQITNTLDDMERCQPADED